MALSTTQFEQLKQKLSAQRTEREANVVAEGEKASKFMSKSLPEQIFSIETAKELPKEALNTIVGGAARFLTSAAEAPATILSGGKTSGTEYNIPGLKPFKSFQSTAAENVAGGESVAKNVTRSLYEVPLAAMDLVGAGELIKGGAKGLSAVRQLKPTIKPSGEFLSGLVDSVKKGVSAPLKYAGEKTGLTRYLSKENVAPQAQTALESAPAKLAKDYEDFYNMTVKQIKDAKADTALNKVGNEAGKAFDKVVLARKNIGQKMGAELKKIGDVKTDIAEPIINFETRLKDEAGLVFDKAKQGLVSLGKQTKMTGEEQGLISDFLGNVKKLGANPTVQELDAFLSRVPKELDIYKNKNAITGTTHAESLIKNTLSNMRGAFDPKKNPAFKGYSQARTAYSKLSDFLDEGVGFLGKKTLTGDYAKDASLLKSSVQSLLNNGKKDFLLELEKLSGYPAIDKAVVALQAMKDAGDFKGLSLLETLAGQGAKSGSFADIPTSAKGLVEKTLRYGMEKAGQVVGGTPKERTLRFIKDLKK